MPPRREPEPEPPLPSPLPEQAKLTPNASLEVEVKAGSQFQPEDLNVVMLSETAQRKSRE